MALELAEYNFKDVEWIINNLDVYHFVKKMNYKKYQAYVNYKASQPDNLSNNNYKDELE